MYIHAYTEVADAGKTKRRWCHHRQPGARWPGDELLERPLAIAGCLCEEFPLLFTHAVGHDVSVAVVVSEGIDAQLVPRISRGAATELQEVRQLLARVVLTVGADSRSSAVVDDRNTLRSGPVYSALMAVAGTPSSPYAKFVWKNRAPPGSVSLPGCSSSRKFGVAPTL